MTSPEIARCIALWGCFHAGDRVDALIAQVLLRELRLRQPGARLLGFAPEPSEVVSQHGIDARSLPPAASALASRAPAARRLLGGGSLRSLWGHRAPFEAVDVLIVAGADPLRDCPAGAARLEALAKRSGTRLDLLGLGLGPDAAGEGAPDPLFALAPPVERPPGVERASAVERPVVCVHATPATALGLSNFVAWLLLERYEVRLLALNDSERRVCHELEGRLRAEGLLPAQGRLAEGLAADQDPEGVLRGCGLVVASGPHAMLLAALRRIPVLGLGDEPPSGALLQSLGQTGFALPCSGLSTARLVDAFCLLRANAAQIRDTLGARVPERRKVLHEHYDSLYGPRVDA